MRLARAFAIPISLSIVIAGLPAPVFANVFSHILKEAGEAGGKAAGHGLAHLGAVGKAAEHLRGLASAPKAALAAHATPEGHWQFVNREGQIFTAGAPDEFKRVLPSLAPEAAAAGETKLSLYLSEDSVFQNRAYLDELPKDAELHVVTDSGALPVMRSGSGASAVLKAKVKPNLVVELREKDVFDEIVGALGRPLNKSNIRTIALEPGAPTRLRSAPNVDPVTKTPLVDTLDPAHLYDAFRTIRGQTAMIVGRVENGKLHFSPSSGGEISHDVEDLIRAAAENDINLIVLQTDAARQPGGRNWLWQKIEVGGLGDASKAASFGDFLDAMGARRGGFQLAASREGSGRVQILAQPIDGGAGLTGEAASMFEDTVGHVTGEIVTKAIDIHSRDQSSELENDARLIPGIPTFVQIPYLAAVIAGLISWGTVRSWWRRIWPPRDTSLQSNRGVRLLSKLGRELSFFLFFLPLAGLPALLWQMAVQTWVSVTSPFRWLHRRFLRREV